MYAIATKSAQSGERIFRQPLVRHPVRTCSKYPPVCNENSPLQLSYSEPVKVFAYKHSKIKRGMDRAIKVNRVDPIQAFNAKKFFNGLLISAEATAGFLLGNKIVSVIKGARGLLTTLAGALETKDSKSAFFPAIDIISGVLIDIEAILLGPTSIATWVQSISKVLRGFVVLATSWLAKLPDKKSAIAELMLHLTEVVSLVVQSITAENLTNTLLALGTAISKAIRAAITKSARTDKIEKREEEERLALASPLLGNDEVNPVAAMNDPQEKFTA